MSPYKDDFLETSLWTLNNRPPWLLLVAFPYFGMSLPCPQDCDFTEFRTPEGSFVSSVKTPYGFTESHIIRDRHLTHHYNF